MPGGIVENLGASPSQRKKLFYGVCIPLRLLLAYIVYLNPTSYPMRLMVTIFSASSMYSNILGLNSTNSVWWDRKFHFTMSSLSLILSMTDRIEYVPSIMVIDILYGVIHSFASDPWDLK